MIAIENNIAANPMLVSLVAGVIIIVIIRLQFKDSKVDKGVMF